MITGTRSKESSQRATVRTERVTRDEAERRGARNVAEALAGEPSLQVNPQAYGHLGSPSGVQMQGLDGDRVLVLEDGEPVIGEVGGIVDLAQLPLSGVDRIEYVVGPMSSLYGSNALGGVINIVTAPPRFEGPSARARVEGRTSGDVLIDAGAAYRDGDTWAAIEGSHSHRGSHELDAGPALLVPGGATDLIGLRTGFRPWRPLSVRLKARYAYDHNDGLTTQEVPGLGTYLIHLPDRTDRLTLSASERIELGRGSQLEFSLARSLFRGRSERDREDSPVDETRKRAADLQSFEAIATLADGEERTWVIGVRSESESFSEEVRRVVASSGGLVTRVADEVQPTLLSSAAAYAQLGYQLSDAFSIMPGVRSEFHDRYGAVAAPRLALALRSSDLVALRLSGGRGFRAPTAKEYGFVFDHSVIGYRVLGNPDLDPETSWGASADVTVRPERHVRVRVGGFANWVNHLISFEVAETQNDPTVTDYVYVNIARARTAGTDAMLRVEPMPGMNASVAYAYLFTRDDTTGEPLPNRPPHTLTAAFSGDLPLNLNVTLRYRYMTETFVTADLATPPHSLFDWRIGYSVARFAEFYIGGLNQFDVQRDPYRAGDARPTLGTSYYLGFRGEIGAED